MPDLFNANDGLTGRDGGPYLDQIEQKHAEDQRAKVEGREPNYETMGGYAGTRYVTAQQLMNTESLNNNPSQADVNVSAVDSAVAALVADDSNSLKVAFAAPDIEGDEGDVAEETPVTDTSTDTNGSAPVAESFPVLNDPPVENTPTVGS